MILHGCMKTDLSFAVITLAVGNNHEDTDIIRLIDFLVASHLDPLNLPRGNASAGTVILHYYGQALLSGTAAESCTLCFSVMGIFTAPKQVLKPSLGEK